MKLPYNEEVFLLILHADSISFPTEIYVFKTLQALNIHLSTELLAEVEDMDSDTICVFNGIATSARFIPESFDGCTPYIIVHKQTEQLNENEETGALFEKISGGAQGVVEKIQHLVTTNVIGVDIDDIHLFFGQELTLILAVDDTDIDEELIDRVKKVTTKITEQKTNIKDEHYETED